VRDLIRESCAQQDSLVSVERFHEDRFDSLKPITFLVGELNQMIQLLEEHICNKVLPNPVWDAVSQPVCPRFRWRSRRSFKCHNAP
jgi:hypothetical protein